MGKSVEDIGGLNQPADQNGEFTRLEGRGSTGGRRKRWKNMWEFYHRTKKTLKQREGPWKNITGGGEKRPCGG